jgi:hypothetical protein
VGYAVAAALFVAVLVVGTLAVLFRLLELAIIVIVILFGTGVALGWLRRRTTWGGGAGRAG